MTHTTITKRLIDSGFAAYYVGGGVRDILLGRIPKDHDICTDATPDEVLALFPRAELVGAKFGVVLIGAVEVATFRTEGVYTDGRRPDSVSFTKDVREDVQRRDFTFNGVLRHPVSEELVDHVGGVADLLEHRVVRCIGSPDDRFLEDHLRMLRAVRFAARLGFSIEAETFAAIRRHASLVEKIAPERVRGELDRMLTGSNAHEGFRLLIDTGLMAHIAPELLQTRGCEQPPIYHPEGDVYTHTRLMLENLPENPSVPLALAVLFHDAGKPFTRIFEGRIKFPGHELASEKILNSFLRRFLYSSRVSDEALFLVREHMRVGRLDEMRTSKQKRLAASSYFEDLCELHRLDCVGSNGDMSSYEFARTLSFESETIRTTPRLVTGADLIALGLKPGPEFKIILDEMYDLQLEGASREVALERLVGMVAASYRKRI